MTTFLLIRHGATDAVAKSLIGWKPGWRLTSAGKHRIERLAETLSRLPIRAVYSSPLERALETAAILARPHGLAPQADENLGEMHFGSWEGLTIEELDQREDWRRFNTVRSLVRPPGGELMIEVQARMVRQMETLQSRHPQEMVAVISHGDPLRALVAHYLGMPIDHILRFEIAPGSVSVVQAGDWQPRLLCLNETGEVPL
jgi:broad specificity phosphatase PhoE